MLATLPISRRSTPIGIDFGDTGVRAVQLQSRREGYALVRSATLERRVGSESPEGTDDLDKQLRHCLLQGEFSGRQCVAAVQPQSVQFHALELPPAQPQDMERLVHIEIERLLGSPEAAVETRYWLLPPTKVAAPTVLGISVARETVEQSLTGFERAGLHCLAMDASAAALARFGSLLQPRSADDIWGLLDLGQCQTRLILCIGSVPVLIRAVGPGGSDWTTRIAQALGISTATAEIHKRDHGIVATARAERALDPALADVDLATVLTGILRADLLQLAAEIKRSYEYVLSCYPNRRAADLVLVGGGAQMPNLDAFLLRNLGIVVRRASDCINKPGGRILGGVAKRHSWEQLALAIGLAVRE